MKYICACALICMLGIKLNFAQAADTTYPGLPIEHLHLQMTESQLKELVQEIRLVSLGNQEDVGMVKIGQVNCLFFFQDGKLVRLNYGWNDMNESEIKKKISDILVEFSNQFGTSTASTGARAAGGRALTVSTRIFKLGPAKVAVVEAWGSSILVTIGSELDIAESEKRLNARNQKLLQAQSLDAEGNRKGIMNFTNEKEDTSNNANRLQDYGVQGSTEKVPDYIKAIQ